MIVSHSRKFIFIKTRKAAGTSLEMVLTRYCGPEDIVTELDDADERNRLEWIGSGARNFAIPFSELSLKNKMRRIVGAHRKAENDSVHRLSRFNEHDGAAKARALLGAKTFDDYFKFTIVRDPFDRAVSSYAFERVRQKKLFAEHGVENIGQYVRAMPHQINENWRLYAQGDRMLVDDFVRYECLEHDLARISARIGLDHNIFEDLKGVRAKSSFRQKGADPTAELTPDDRRLIGELCRLEMALFGYGAEEATTAS